MIYLCIGSNTSRYANSHTENGVTTADCWDCPGRFELVSHSRATNARLILPKHYEDGTLRPVCAGCGEEYAGTLEQAEEQGRWIQAHSAPQDWFCPRCQETP